MRRWAFTRAGANAPISSPRSLRASRPSDRSETNDNRRQTRSFIMSATEQNAAPSTQTNAPVRGGVIPYLQVDGAVKAADFYRRAFGAEEVARHPVDEKGRTMHVHLIVNGGSLMLGDAYPEHGHPLQA